MKIAILGAGAFGTALGGILTDNGYEIAYYDTRLDVKLNDVLVDADKVLIAVPSKSVPYVLPHLSKDLPLIVATKGILSEEAFAEFKNYAIISGPGYADDMKAHKKVTLTVTDKDVAKLFKADYIDFDFTDDKRGVLMCGALKNVYAIGAGYLGLERGTETWQNFIEAVSEEIKAILALNGANPETMDLACGILDLQLTCGFPSRNYEYGQKLKKNKNVEPDKTVEGLTAMNKINQGVIKIPESAKYLTQIKELLCN